MIARICSTGAEALGIDFDEHLTTVIAALDGLLGRAAARELNRHRDHRPRQLSSGRMAEPIKIVVLDGDETGQELLEQSLRVLDSELLGFEVEFERFDLSLEIAAPLRTASCTKPPPR